MSAIRDPQTGKLLWPVSMDIHLTDSAIPQVISCKNWASAAAYLKSPEFRSLSKRVSLITITNREAQ